MIKTVLLILINFCVLFAQAHKSDTPKIKDKADLVFDSLITDFNSESSDTIKINLLNEISWYYAPTNFEKSILFADSALVYSRKVKWKKGEAYALKNKGEALRYKGEIKNALLNHEVSLSIFEVLKDKTGIASLNSNIGIAYFMLSDFPKAFEYYSKALEITKEIGANQGVLKNLSLIGVLFYTFSRYEEALDYYNSALKIARSIKSEDDIALQLGNIGLTQIKLEKYKDAISNLNEALVLFEKNNDKYNYSIFSGNIGIAYLRMNSYEKADNHFQYSLEISKEINDKYGIANQYGNLGMLKLENYFNIKEADKSHSRSKLLIDAEKYLKKSLDEFDKLGILENQSYFTLKLANLYKEKRDFKKALFYNEAYIKLQDSLFSAETNKKMAEMGVKQNLLLKEMEIELLNKENVYQRVIRQILIGIALVFVFVSIVIYYQYSNKRKQNDVLEENIKDRETAEAALRNNEIELNKHKNNLEMLVRKRTSELEEEINERKRTEEDLLIAIDRVEAANKAKTVFLENMSHELRTPLVGILGYSDLLASEVESKELKEMADGINRTGNRLLNTLSMVLDLARIESDKFEINVDRVDIRRELTEIYENFKGAVAVKNIDFELNISDNVTEVFTDANIFKIIVENLVNNAIKFTKEGSISINSEIIEEKSKEYLKVDIVDTGIGIRKNEIPMIFREFKQLSEGTLKDFQGTGLGLSISKRFIEHLGGKLSVESEFGVGSKFSIKISTT